MIVRDFGPIAVPKARTFLLSPRQKLLVLAIGDIHYGSAGWPERRFRRDLQEAVDRGAWFLGMGDMTDFTSASQRAILSSMRESQREILDTMKRREVERFAEILKPTAGRWIGCVEGDHFHPYADGTTSDQDICQRVGAPFLGSSGLCRIRLKRPSGRAERLNGCTVRIYGHHGLGGGRLLGSGLNMVERLRFVVNSDVYLMGHNHAQVTARSQCLDITPGGHVHHRTLVFARTGGYLVGYSAGRPKSATDRAELSRGSYVEKRALAPTAMGGVYLSLGYERHQCSDTGEEICVPDVHVST